jgi:hypothetical protein
MSWRHYTILFIVGLIVPTVVASYQNLPGYIDADYYFAGGLQLFDGKGFTEPYLWNYLDDPAGLPHPSHAYWMPLASIVSALGMWITGQRTYYAGRLAFILLSACVPLLTAALAENITHQPRLAMASGFLAIFSLFYAPFMPVPDNYVIFMVLGALYFLISVRPRPWLWLGIISGLLTLARSDGLLWLALTGLFIFMKQARKPDDTKISFIFSSIIPAGLIVLAGYLLVMGGWHIRNLTLFGSPMTPGGGRLIWMQNYFETFIYPAGKLSQASFLQAGWDIALGNRLEAFGSNIFVSALISQGGIFFAPFMAIGLIYLRHDVRTRIAVAGWLILLAVMTFVFPFAGSRGSFFHAGAAFQPYWWAVAPIGLDVIVEKARARGRLDESAYLLFSSIMVLLAIILTTYLVYIRVVVNEWPKDDGNYASVEKMLVENGGRPGEIVIVRNPPGYYIASERPAIVIPYGDESVLLAVAKRYNAHYLILEDHGVYNDIKALYDNPQQNPLFDYMGEVNGARLYRIDAR